MAFFLLTKDKNYGKIWGEVVHYDCVRLVKNKFKKKVQNGS